MQENKMNFDKINALTPKIADSHGMSFPIPKPLVELNNLKIIFYNFENIEKAIVDIQDSCDIGEHCIAFIIAEYGINMYLKQIHKTIPTSLRTKFVRPKIHCINHLKKVYTHYMEKFCESFNIIKNFGCYCEDVNYPNEQNICSKVSSVFAYDNTTKSIEIHISGSKIVKKDSDCRGGLTISDSGVSFKMCRYQGDKAYLCFCDADY